MTRGLKWRIAIGLVLVFAAGAATGTFAGARHARRTFVAHHGEFRGDRMREHLTRRLNLTPEQLRQIEPIIEQTSRQLQAIRADTGKRVSEAMEQSRDAMAPHLTPAQLEKLEKMRRRRMEEPRQRRRDREHRRDRPPRPDGSPFSG